MIVGSEFVTATRLDVDVPALDVLAGEKIVRWLERERREAAADAAFWAADYQRFLDGL